MPKVCAACDLLCSCDVENIFCADATQSWLTQSTNAKAGSHTLVIDGEPFKLCKRWCCGDDVDGDGDCCDDDNNW